MNQNFNRNISIPINIMIFSPHKDFKIAVYLFEPDPELHSGTERSSFSDKFRRPGPEPSVLSVILAGGYGFYR